LLSVVVFPNKKPAIVSAIAGFSEICCFVLENSTHDAKRPGAAVPGGQASLDQRRALRFNRGCHFSYVANETPFSSHCQSKLTVLYFGQGWRGGGGLDVGVIGSSR
jgi:hypothetical protein